MSWLLIAAAVAAAPESLPSRPIWATVTRTPAAGRGRTDIGFGTLGTTGDRPRRLVYYARRSVSRPQGEPEVQWADSLSCPALVETLSDLRGLNIPRIDIPGFPAQRGGMDEEIVLDGIIYELSVTHALRLSSNVGSPLAAWTERTLESLSDCWRSTPPRDID